MKRFTVSTAAARLKEFFGKSSFAKTTFMKWKEEHPRLLFALRVIWYYGMMMALFFYFMLANLSSAPKFVYTAF